MIRYGVIDFYIGFLAGVKAFTAAVLGGIGSLPGAVLGGLLIGLIETFWSAYFSVAVQGCRRLLHPGDHADLPAHRPARPAGGGEGMSAPRGGPSATRRIAAAVAFGLSSCWSGCGPMWGRRAA